MPTITVKRYEEKEAVYLKVDALVRYPEDASINGVPDDENDPKMPFLEGELWKPIINLETGQILDWPAGTTASVHYKVCDAGVYSILDKDQNELVKLDGYVPKILCPKDSGYGDYIIMDIGPDGTIADWTADLDYFEED